MPNMYPFEDFWAIWPDKRNIGRARIWWKSHKPSMELGKTIVEAVIWQSKAGTLKRGYKYTPHASTWLNGARWLDENPAEERKKAAEYAKRARGQKQWQEFFDANSKYIESAPEARLREIYHWTPQYRKIIDLLRPEIKKKHD